jgi:hypothetical protein
MNRANCYGGEALSTRVDRETMNEIETVADRHDITRAELLRRLIDVFRDSRRGAFRCPDCSSRIRMNP